MKVKRAFCEDCNEYRPFQYDPPCTGTESCIWFVLGIFFFPFWFVLLWRNLSFNKKWNCQQCASSKYREVK